MLWAKNRRKSVNKWEFWHKNHIFRDLKSRGGNKNGWMGGDSWYWMIVRYEGAKMESFEIGLISKLDRCYNYLTVKQRQEQAEQRRQQRTTRPTTTTTQHQHHHHHHHDHHHPSGLGPSLLDSAADGPCTRVRQKHYWNSRCGRASTTRINVFMMLRQDPNLCSTAKTVLASNKRTSP